MGKLKRRLDKKPGFEKRKSGPLHEQLQKQTKEKFKKPKKVKFEGDDLVIDSKLTNKILVQAREQLFEENEQESNVNNSSQKEIWDSSINIITYNEEDKPKVKHVSDHQKPEETAMSQSEMDAFEQFMSSDFSVREALAEEFSERLTERKSELMSDTLSGIFPKTQSSISCTTPMLRNPQIQTLYKSVGSVLAQYRSGKLPKAFKVIPSLSDWEAVLELTNPTEWSSAAMNAATKLFASNLNSRLVQRFYNKILLPRVRDDIAEYKKLNFHLYQALFKAMFKQGAFFKGIIIPLAQSSLLTSNNPNKSDYSVVVVVNKNNDTHFACTLREAYIFCTVLQKQSITPLHAAACMCKLLEISMISNTTDSRHEENGTDVMEENNQKEIIKPISVYSGPICLMLRVLIDKGYELPDRVIQAFIDYFQGFSEIPDTLPVIWHQCLLSFVTKYCSTLTDDEKCQLKLLCKTKHHEKISPIIMDIIEGKSFDSSNSKNNAKEKIVLHKSTNDPSDEMVD